jgi:hypothetical protein
MNFNTLLKLNNLTRSKSDSLPSTHCKLGEAYLTKHHPFLSTTVD